MPTEDQQVSPLTPADEAELQKRVRDVETFLEIRFGEVALEGASSDLDLLQRLLDDRVIPATETYFLQSLGVVLGEVFVRELGFHWVMVEDNLGRDPALRFQETSIIVFPLTMISKRVERGRDVDCHSLYQATKQQLESLRDVAG